MSDSLKDVVQKAMINASQDEQFKSRLLSDPVGVITELGAQVPEGIDLKVVEDTTHLRHIILPTSGEMSDDDLDEVAGGCPIV